MNGLASNDKLRQKLTFVSIIDNAGMLLHQLDVFLLEASLFEHFNTQFRHTSMTSSRCLIEYKRQNHVLQDISLRMSNENTFKATELASTNR